VVVAESQQSEGAWEGVAASALGLGDSLAVDFGVNALLEEGRIKISHKNLSGEPQLIRRGDSLARFTPTPFSEYTVSPATTEFPEGLQGRIYELRANKILSHPEVCNDTLLATTVPQAQGVGSEPRDDEGSIDHGSGTGRPEEQKSEDLQQDWGRGHAKENTQRACCQRACASAVVLDVNGGCWNSRTANRTGNSVGTSCRTQKFDDRPGMAAAELVVVNGVCGNADKANRDTISVGTSCRAQKFGDRPGVVSAEFPEGWKSFC
jgi:hypothetical protein